jgi:predicted Fe-Mo cluster-binding NifX family protein
VVEVWVVAVVEEWVVVDKMALRILIPVEDQTRKSLAQHFGRAPYFAVFDLDADGAILNNEVYPNSGEHSGGRGHAHNNVLRLNPNVVIVQGMGPRGIMSFQDQNIAVLQANSTNVDDILDAYNQGKLPELTEGCADAHHR